MNKTVLLSCLNICSDLYRCLQIYYLQLEIQIINFNELKVHVYRVSKRLECALGSASLTLFMPFMDSSFWFDTIYLDRYIIDIKTFIKGSLVMISK